MITTGGEILKKADEFHQLQNEAEENCISIAVLAPHTIELMASVISRRDFMEKLMGDIWQLIVDLREAGEGFDTKKFMTECTKRGYIKMLGGPGQLARIVNRAPNHAMGEYYARELARLSEIRRVENAMLSAMEDLKSLNADPVRVVQILQSRIEGVGNSKDAGFRKFNTVAEDLIKKDSNHSEEAQAKTVFPTGFAGLDRKIRGLSPGKLTLLGGRTGMGKSALACNIAVNIALAGRTVWIASLEMEADELGERIISDKANISMDSWRRKLGIDEQYEAKKFHEGVGSRLPLWITDKGHESLSTLKGKARLRKSLGGLDVLIIDNLQLIKALDYKSPKHERLKSMTEALKNMAKEMQIAILLLCQLAVPDEAERKSNKPPDSSSWGDSKRIEDDADTAFLLHRPSKSSTEATLILLKNRNGQLGEVNLAWEGEYQRFSDT